MRSNTSSRSTRHSSQVKKYTVAIGSATMQQNKKSMTHMLALKMVTNLFKYS